MTRGGEGGGTKRGDGRSGGEDGRGGGEDGRGVGVRRRTAPRGLDLGSSSRQDQHPRSYSA